MMRCILKRKSEFIALNKKIKHTLKYYRLKIKNICKNIQYKISNKNKKY